MIVAITGGIASGKSIALKYFKEQGCHVLNADTIYHSLIERGKPLYGCLVLQFGESILTQEKEIDLKKLANIVFADKEKLRALNASTHGAIAEEIKKQSQNHKLTFVEVPLLYESGMQSNFDKIILITANVQIKLRRMYEKRDMDFKTAKTRIDSQLPDSAKAADVVLENNGTVEEFLKKLAEVKLQW